MYMYMYITVYLCTCTYLQCGVERVIHCNERGVGSVEWDPGAQEGPHAERIRDANSLNLSKDRGTHYQLHVHVYQLHV